MKLTVKQARVGANLTQREVADALEIHENTYRKLEENPEGFTMGRAEAFAAIVGVDMNDILWAKTKV